jgi:hypothetical protein
VPRFLDVTKPAFGFLVWHAANRRHLHRRAHETQDEDHVSVAPVLLGLSHDFDDTAYPRRKFGWRNVPGFPDQVELSHPLEPGQSDLPEPAIEPGLAAFQRNLLLARGGDEVKDLASADYLQLPFPFLCGFGCQVICLLPAPSVKSRAPSRLLWVLEDREGTVPNTHAVCSMWCA